MAPFGWNVVYNASIRAGAGGRIYLFIAAVHTCRLAVTATMLAPLE